MVSLLPPCDFERLNTAVVNGYSIMSAAMTERIRANGGADYNVELFLSSQPQPLIVLTRLTRANALRALNALSQYKKDEISFEQVAALFDELANPTAPEPAAVLLQQESLQ